jgi:hypothetical protein
LAWLERQRLTTAQLIDALSLGDVGNSAFQIAHPMQDDGTVDVGVREIRIEIDRQIKIDECKRKSSAAIGQAALLSVVSGVPHLDIGNCRSGGYVRDGVRRCHFFGRVASFRRVGDRDVVKLVAWVAAPIGSGGCACIAVVKADAR